MARKMPGRSISRPAQGRNSTRPISKNRIVGPLVRTSQHSKPRHGGSRPGANG